MALPNAYLTSYKNTGDLLQAITAAQAPDRFTIKFLDSCGPVQAAGAKGNPPRRNQDSRAPPPTFKAATGYDQLRSVVALAPSCR
jgi:hypothetical protein